MTILETFKTFVWEEFMQIQGKVFWCEFKEVSKSIKVDNKVDKDEAESHIITNLMTLALELRKLSWAEK